MNSRFFALQPLSLFLSGAVLCAASAGCDRTAGAHSLGERASGSLCSVADAPLTKSQAALLDIAFEAVSAMPPNPHIKNRSRGQEAVVAVCLELEQPRRALAFIEKIDNWRRGTAYAELALYCARNEGAADVQPLLDLAREVSGTAEGEPADNESEGGAAGQAWRRDRIRAKIASAHLWLGDADQAAEFAAGLVDSESGTVSATKATLLDADALEAELATLDEIVHTGSFEQVRGALATSAQIFNRFYGDESRRSRVEEGIERCWKKVPIMVQIEVTMELAGFALDHEDQSKAIELLDGAQLLLEGSHWTPEYEIPLMARLAGMRHRAGDHDGARAQADAARATFDAKRDAIQNFERADALRPLAEAYQTMGDTRAALAVYAQAIADGAENPNARPRADDLSATCCSMAAHGVEPDLELQAQIRRILEGLTAPW